MKGEKHWVNAANLVRLVEILPQMQGIRADLTVRVSLEELAKLPQEKCTAFLEGIAVIVSACPVASLDRDDGGGAE